MGASRPRRRPPPAIALLILASLVGPVPAARAATAKFGAGPAATSPAAAPSAPARVGVLPLGAGPSVPALGPATALPAPSEAARAVVSPPLAEAARRAFAAETAVADLPAVEEELRESRTASPGLSEDDALVRRAPADARRRDWSETRRRAVRDAGDTARALEEARDPRAPALDARSLAESDYAGADSKFDFAKVLRRHGLRRGTALGAVPVGGPVRYVVGEGHGEYHRDVALVVPGGVRPESLARTLALGADPGPWEAAIRRAVKRGAEPLLLSLKALLPAFAKRATNARASCEGPNCWNATLNFHDPRRGLGYTGEWRMKAALLLDYRRLRPGDSLRYGDVVAFYEGRELLHTAVYVDGNLLWHKASMAAETPYVFESWRSVYAHYHISAPEFADREGLAFFRYEPGPLAGPRAFVRGALRALKFWGRPRLSDVPGPERNAPPAGAISASRSGDT